MRLIVGRISFLHIFVLLSCQNKYLLPMKHY
jgi:hypothetical protein